MSIGSTASVASTAPRTGGASATLIRDQQRLAADTATKATASRLNTDRQAVTHDRQTMGRNIGSRFDRYV